MQVPLAAPVTLDAGPVQPVVYQHRVTLNAAQPVLTAADIDKIGQANARGRYQQLGMSTHGSLDDLQKRLKKYYRV